MHVRNCEGVRLSTTCFPFPPLFHRPCPRRCLTPWAARALGARTPDARVSPTTSYSYFRTSVTHALRCYCAGGKGGSKTDRYAVGCGRGTARCVVYDIITRETGRSDKSPRPPLHYAGKTRGLFIYTFYFVLFFFFIILARGTKIKT